MHIYESVPSNQGEYFAVYGQRGNFAVEKKNSGVRRNKTRKQLQDQVNRLYRLQSDLDRRDRNAGGNSQIARTRNQRDRYGSISQARGNMLRQRGYTDVQNYGNDDSVLMTRAQVRRMDSISNPIAKANYVNRVYQGLSNG